MRRVAEHPPPRPSVSANWSVSSHGRKKALAETAALLVLKKTVENIYQDEDEDIDGENEK